MTAFAWLKLVHICCAFMSIGGFSLRGYWMFTDNTLLQSRPAKVLPHIIDSVLLGSAVGMLVVWRVSPLQIDWLSAKVIALLVYIGLGMIALRFGKTRGVRITAWLFALLTAAYIVSVAYSKSPLGFLSLV